MTSITRAIRNQAAPVFRALWPAATLALVFSLAGSPASAQAPVVRSTLDGVYTEAQADSGAVIYQNVCGNCHNSGTPLAGTSFLGKWTGRPLYAIWDYLTSRMPYGNPGSLTHEQYANVLSYILRLNEYPSGPTPLPHLPFEVANIDFITAPPGD